MNEQIRTDRAYKGIPYTVSAGTPQPGPESSDLVVKARHFTLVSEVLEELDKHPEWLNLRRGYDPIYAFA